MKYLFTVLPAIAFAGSAFAAPAAAEDTARVLGEVVVVQRAAKAPVALLPLDVRVIDSQTLEQSSQTNILPVLQNRVPGMFVTERGLAGYGVSGGAAGTVNIRGVGGGGKVLFLIDGQPQWAGVFGHPLPDTYVTADVQRVEVVSGPSSLLYGSGAMGGSVNIITQTAHTDGFTGSLRAEAGSYGTMKFGAKGAFKRRGWRTFAAASYERSDGNRPGMNFWLANQFASLSYEFSPHWQAGANVMLTETRAENPGSTYLAQPLDMWTKMLRTTASVFVKNSFARSSGGVQAYYNYGRHKIDDGVSNGRPRPYLFNSKDFNMGVTAYQTVRPWDDNNLSLGIDFKHWGGEAWNAAKADGARSPIVNRHVNEIAGYAMMQQAMWSNRLSLNAGVRLEHSSQFGNQWVPQAGFILRPVADTRLKFSYGKGFRSPNIRELYMYDARNPELEPEQMHNFEVELRRWVLGGRLNVGAAVYYINGDNLIQIIRVDGSPRNVNTGRFINKGFELDATCAPHRQWNFTANYAYLHTSAPIVAAPRNKLFAEVAFSPGRWQLSVDVLSVWDVLTERDSESYALLNARVAYALSAGITLFAKGENLTATRYEINAGFPMPRATALAGLEWRF